MIKGRLLFMSITNFIILYRFYNLGIEREMHSVTIAIDMQFNVNKLHPCFIIELFFQSCLQSQLKKLNIN